MKKETGYPSIDKTHEEGFSYFKRNPIIPDMSIYNAISLINIFNRNLNAIECMDLNVSYKELLDEAIMISKSFKEMGIKKGDIITVCTPNTYQAVAVFLAANRIGAVTTFLNYLASDNEIKEYLNLFESPLFINYNRTLDYNEKIKKETKVRQIITLSKDDLYKKRSISMKNSLIGYSDFISYGDLSSIANYYKKIINPLHSSKDDALILYTSGSSGNPKAVLLTNENVLASGIYIKNTINLPQTKGDKCLCFVPFKYPYGFATSVLLTLMCSRTVVIVPDGLNEKNVQSVLPKINYYYGSPALLDVLRTIVPDNVNLSLSHTFVTGGDFFTDKTEKMGREFFTKHNCDNMTFCNGAGNAETVATWSSSVGTIVRPGTVGRILVGEEPIVVNPDTLKEVKYDEEGTLLLRGKNVFKGYYNSPELTSHEKVIIDGKEYYNTRTVGKLSRDRFFSLIGRESRFYILSDGNKVYCEKIQNFISSLDIVESCVVVGKPDDQSRFVGKAYVVLRNGILPDEQTRNYIFEQCTKELVGTNNEVLQLNSFEIPASIDFVEKIDLTEADKINYKEYEKMALDEYENEKKNKMKVRVM